MTNNGQLQYEARSFGRRIGVATSPWIVVDAVVWAVMFIVALWMRFDFSTAAVTTALTGTRLYAVMFGLLALSCLNGWVVGLYRGRFIPGSLLEISTLTTVFAGSTILVFFAQFAARQYEGIPRSTPIVAGAFTTLTALVLRSIVRRKELFGAGVSKDAEPAIVFGSGSGGVQLVKHLRRSESSGFNPLAILDDDPSKHHMLVEGVRVYGGREQIASIAKRTGAGILIVAIPSLPGEELIDVRDRAESAGLHVLVLPSLDSMMRGRVAANELREINVNDLLGRKPARLNQTEIADYLRGKSILVTGAGGSIGSELCRQIRRFRPAELIMLDRDESGLHSVQLSMNDQAMLDGDDTVLASIRDREIIQRIFNERRPQIVFHAAALKHMPLLEQYPLEAVKTNVIGTKHVLDAAVSSGVETFVNISTDKAANPCTALGTSKRIAERLTANAAGRAPTSKFVSVRFGNVLGSRGSVLTVFEQQIREGGPVTVTDPDVERFFMTIPEACQLVLQASVVGQTAETLVLDMGEPIKISEVARTLIEQSGRQIDIVYTGLRENEKLSEDLFDDSELDGVETRHTSISAVRIPSIDIEPSALETLSGVREVHKWLASKAET